LGKFGVITPHNPNTEQHFNTVCWLGCDIVIYYEGIFSQFWWLLPSCMMEMVLQKWLVIMFTHSCCGVGWHTRTPWTSYTKAVIIFVHDGLCWSTYFEVTGWYHWQDSSSSS